MSVLLTIIAVICILSPIILIHEAGHYIACRVFGIRVEEFAIGMGKKLWSKQKGETLFSIRAVPFGGFVKTAGEMFLNKDAPAPKEYEFAAKKWYAKFLMVISGAAMNYVLAFIIFTFIVFVSGMPETDAKKITAEIGGVAESMPAGAAGLKEGDMLVSINGAALSNWGEVVPAIASSEGDLNIVYTRGGERLETVVPASAFSGSKRQLGVTPKIELKKAGAFESVKLGAYQCYYWTALSLGSIYDSFAKKKAPDLAGPVGIVNIVHQAVKSGWMSFFSLLALLSLAVGMFNLFPIPILDGGYAVMFLWEGISRRKVTEKFVLKAVNVGFVLIIMLVVYATYQDVGRIVTGKKAVSEDTTTEAPAK